MNQNKQAASDDPRPSRGIMRFGAYALLVLAWIYAVPGWFAYRSHVMRQHEIVERLPLDAKNLRHRYDRATAEYESCIDSTRMDIVDATANPAAVDLAIRRQQACTTGLKNLTEPVLLAPFAGNWLSDIWVICYLGLGILVVVNSERSEPLLSISRRGLFIVCGLYLAFDWDNYIRNFLLSNVLDGRKIYSFVNWDVSHASFILQELRSLGMMILIAMLWERYFAAHQQMQIKVSSPAKIEEESLVKEVQNYKGIVLRWQTDSILVALVFFPFVYFFWHEIEGLHDTRYFPSAIAIQIIGITTWYLASRPLLIASRWWQEQKLSAMMRGEIKSETLQAVVATADSATELQLLGAAVAAAASFIVPIVRALF